MFLRSKRLFLRPFWPEERLGENALAITLPGAAVRGGCVPIIGAARFERLGGTARLDLAIAPEWRRQGYATEAGEALVDWARTLGLGRIVAPRHAESPAALRLCSRLGIAGDWACAA